MNADSALIIPDTHAPFHDERAVEAMIAWVKKRKHPFNRVIMMGDGADFYAASHFKKDPKRKFLIVEEAMGANDVMKSYRKLGRIGHYIMGNHEARLRNYILEHAPALDGITSAEKLLGLEDWDTITPYKKHLRLGKCYFTHDLEQFGANAVRGALASYQHSVVIGHTHRMSLEYKGNATGQRRVGACFGWLGDVAAVDYRHAHLAKTEWQTGFGHAETDKNGLFHLFQHPIVEGKVLG